MARTDDDTWDLASSVGATATMVAAARAAATREPAAVVHDPYAEPLVRAVGIDLFIRMATGAIGTGDGTGDDAGDGTGDGTAAAPAIMGISRMVDNMAVRTAFFDEFFNDAAEAGIRQAVILASGLDSRGYRLAWPPGTVVFEIDQPQVLEFKAQTLAGLGAQPRCDWRTVPIDLREDWAGALRRAGFDPAAPTVWSAEGLLGYLPPEAQDRLLDTVTALSAPGSRIALDAARPSDPGQHEQSRERMRAIGEQWRDLGFHLDFTELTFIGVRNEAGAYLSGRGWQVDSTGVNELLSTGGRAPFDDDEPMAKLRYIHAALGPGGD